MNNTKGMDISASISETEEITNSIKRKFCRSVDIDFFKNAFGKSVPIESDGNRLRCPLERKIWRIDPRN